MPVDIILFKGKKLNLGYDKVIETKLLKLKEVKQKTKDFVIVEARNSDEARMAAENRNVDMIYGIESSTRKDKMHFRNSGLNQVICKLCRDNNTGIAIPIAEIINTQKRNTVLGRVMQNIKFCRKYKVKMVAASFAKKDSDRRTPADMESFLRALGMTAKEAKESLTNLLEILKTKKKTIRKGVILK